MGGGGCHICGQWVVVRFLFFLVKGQKISVPNDQQCRIFIKKKNLLESSAADKAVASSGLYFFFFLLWCFFQSLKQGEMKGRRECVERWGGRPRHSGRIFAEAPQMMRYYLL